MWVEYSLLWIIWRCGIRGISGQLENTTHCVVFAYFVF